jgi:hypothetical protein
VQFLLGPLQAWSSSASGPPSTGQQPSSQSPQTASPPPAGITNGNQPIESTILAYKVLLANAKKIDDSLNVKTKGKVVVIGTSTDIAAFIQLRIVLAQAGILRNRLETLTAALGQIKKPSYANAPQKPPVKLGTGFIAGPADIATLIQTLGSITAVNESLSTSSGSLNDSTLINLIAQGIGGASVYVPSSNAPHLLTDSDVSNTLIGDALTRLEAARRDAFAESVSYLQAIQDAQIVAPTPKGGKVFSDQEIDAAGQFLEKSTSITAIVNAVAQSAIVVDGFETSLFTGQGVSNNNAGQPNNPSQPNNSGQPAFPAANPAPPLPPAAPAQSNQNAPSQNQGQNQLGPTPSGVTLQQILSVDLLLHDLLTNPAYSSKVQLLSVHALESGGSQLTKSNLFLGSRIYFSGGAVATFGLYDANGTLECSGVGYGYKGYIREKNIESIVKDSTPALAFVSTDCK